MAKLSVRELHGWGKYPKGLSKVQTPSDIKKINLNIKGPVIARGMGRSYGDCSFNDNHTLEMIFISKIIDFDQKKGLINVEAGVLLKDVLHFTVKKGWFPPVSPGTKYVTIAGMLACDVHGKNHHKVGSFSNFVREFKIIDANKKVKTCSINKNVDLFKKTVGGMGLTGIITEVKFQLIKVESPFIKQKVTNYFSLKKLMQRFEGNKDEEYSVAWIDVASFQKKNSYIKSVFFEGKHAKLGELKKLNINYNQYELVEAKLKLPLSILRFFINNFTISLFNYLYFLRNQRNIKFVHYDKFFYPLDSLKAWNNVYGEHGFIQYQFVVPKNKSFESLVSILSTIHSHKCYPTLAVLKLMGKKSDGYLSFAKKGYTLALDFSANELTKDLLNSLDSIVEKYKGNIYLAKDSRMNKIFFKKILKNQILDFNQERNRKTKIHFSSSQSKRLGL